jgi:glycosyltransferase involved in cell wall biosynthesis
MNDAKAPEKHRVVVVMPAYNAAETLQRTYGDIPHERVHKIILVDDASTDRTVEIAKALNLSVYVHRRNFGYGANQKTCYTEALADGADIVVMLHPDYQYDPTLLPTLIEPLERGEADVVLGSRLLIDDALKCGMPWWNYVSNRFLTGLENYVLGLKLSETPAIAPTRGTSGSGQTWCGRSDRAGKDRSRGCSRRGPEPGEGEQQEDRHAKVVGEAHAGE